MEFFLISLLLNQYLPSLADSRIRTRQLWRPTLLFLLFSEFPLNYSVVKADSTSNLGINYGMVADNLPQPTQVVELLKSISVTKTRIYSPNQTVLSAFANSGISIIVGIGNEDVASLTNPSNAANWVQANIAYYHPATQISGILVGNEVFSGDDIQLKNDLFPAMQNLYATLQNLSLDKDVFVSTAHSQAILSASFPPSAGAFASDIASTYLLPMLEFLRDSGSPFMINPYPYFAYKANPQTVSLQYALSASPSPSTGTQTSVAASTVTTSMTDPNTGLVYYNLLDSEVDAIYSALGALGYNDIEVVVSETGWPSAGDDDEAGATVQNAQAYNSNLIARLRRGQGTPAKPNVALEAFIFALFNEDLKTGPTSERHYGLFKPDGTPAYDFGLLSASTDSPVNPYSVYYHISSTSSLLADLTTPLAITAFILNCFLLKDLFCC